MFGKFSTKTLLAAASLAVMTAAGMVSASAAPWDNRHDNHQMADHRGGDRFNHRDGDRFNRHDRFEHRRYVDRGRVNEILRVHRYSVLGDPYFVRGQYVVRTHDRFGRVVFVRIDPYSGAFIGEIRL